MHVQEAEKTLGATIPWICDSMSNDLKHALGNAPNSEFLFGPDGKIVRLRDWSNPETLRKDLEELVAKVDNPTRASDLKLNFKPPEPVAARGVVPRIKTPSRMQPIVTEPQPGKSPYYVKLRVEVERQVLQGESGKMYLGFNMDPLYKVHWNNLAAPIKYTITAPDGTKISPVTGKGPKVEEEGDVDPREFLVDIEGANPDEPIEVSVKYFACNDEQGWCVPVTQKYVIHLKQDRDGGSVRRGGSRGRPGSGSGGGGPDGGFSVARLFRFDKNDDGKVSKAELPQQMQRMLDRFDTNGDGAIDRKEAEEMERRLRDRAGIGGSRSQGDDRRPQRPKRPN